MKVHVNTDGSFDLDVTKEDETKTVAHMIHEITAIKSGNGNGQASKTVSLNPLQFEAWNWMVDNDSEDGIHYSALARGLDITNKSAQQRMIKLVSKDLAYRCGERGRYRAKD
jgi:hypothetical protein